MTGTSAFCWTREYRVKVYCNHSNLLFFFLFQDFAWVCPLVVVRLPPGAAFSLCYWGPVCVFRPAVSQQYAPGAGNVSGPHPSYPQHYGPPAAMQQVTNQMSGMQMNSGPPTPAGPGYGKSGQTHCYYLHKRLLPFDLNLEKKALQSSLSMATEN